MKQIHSKLTTYLLSMIIFLVLIIGGMAIQMSNMSIRLGELEGKNGELSAINTTLESKVESLTSVKKYLVDYTRGLISASKETEEMVTSRGLDRLKTNPSIDEDTYMKIHKLEIENNALRTFYQNTTGNVISEIKEIKIESTMFTNAEGAYAKDSPNYGLMSGGKKTYAGAVAAPRGIPFGSTVLFNNEALPFNVGNRVFTVEDRGGAIIDNGWGICIDIWTDNLEMANQWGRNENTTGYIIIPEE